MTQTTGRTYMVRMILAFVCVLSLFTPSCDNETRIDPEVERNVPPGLREEGTPRDEEN